jgi:cytidylate kinase
MGIVVAIDGPSGAGKSTAAKAIAHRAGWNYLDTGALYRAVTWLALENNCEEAFSILQLLKDHPIRFESDPNSPNIFAGDVQITHSIRGHSVTENVSRISAMPEIRKELLAIQHRIIDASERGVVVEGRDIGTVVAPEAGLKIFLTADLDARARRREDEVEDKSVDVKASLGSRDSIDSTRIHSPLAMANDAVEIDSTNLDLEETIDRIWELLKQRNLLGLPIVASYMILATVCGPGIQAFGIPVLPAHLLMLWFVQTAAISPPSALAAQISANIAGTGFYKTCWASMWLCIPFYIVPLWFLYSDLITGTWSIRLIDTALLSIGFFLLAAASCHLESITT